MTNPKWVIGFVFLFVIFTALSSVVEGADVATGMTRLEMLMNPAGNAWAYLGNLWDMFWFRYAFLDEAPYSLIRYIVFWPVSIGLIVSLVSTTITGVLGFVR